MGRRFSHTAESSGDVETVFDLLSGEDWAAQKASRLHDGSRTVRREVTPGGGVTLVVSRELPAGVPGFLRRFLPADRRVLTTDVWEPADRGGRRGTWTAELPGAPARLGGTMRLEPLAQGTRHTIEGEVTVGVPVVGGRAESFIADKLVRLAEAEAELVRAVLGS